MRFQIILKSVAAAIFMMHLYLKAFFLFLKASLNGISVYTQPFFYSFLQLFRATFLATAE